ncbi:hypothetical protein HMN09_00635300 [Mycena chlorophos]|uniref:Uncharacterized protein n=2 Tax=Mycena chlorophos TaxID=658473 RepID=A0A146H896_MYCCL|nr:hypothetical protein HMN09_00635300 [Mycena chlorophos]GAT44194.1 predicted protein [Mycena chlorophos]
MDYVQNLDPSKLVLGLTALSFITSISGPSYNLPISLYGSIVAQSQESGNSDGQALQTFTALLGVSAVYDIVWMASNDQAWFMRILTIILLLAKIPTFLAFGLALRGSGSSFSGLNIRGGDLGGPTVWSMPGGFSANGYQNLDEEAPRSRPAAPAMPTAQPAPPQQPAATAAAAQPYQTV